MESFPRIATVSLNSAVDQTVTVPRFAIDAVNRVETVRSDAGGKGVNVASFLAHFGHAVTVTGLLGRENEALFAEQFKASGLHDACLRLEGATRTNVKIVDPQGDTVTDLNFPGIHAVAGDLAAVAGRLQTALQCGLDWVALCGSLPAGIEADAYAELTRIARAGGAKVALDTSGTPLELALAAQPDIIKPNIAELSELLGRPLNGYGQVVAAAREIVARGTGLVVVSMGADGAMFVTASEAVHAVAPSPEIASTVGAGDAMVAGLIHSAMQGLPLSQTAALATAFSLGALGEIGPRLPAIDKLQTFARTVQVTALDCN
ncbi:1-phosphofructokinase [Aliiruegeria sabulilitoris]|uniref:1-phosphofructokinase n=1 Tax=Aliiruegeria sabulilitoris TaxID=1510458 RepID=UPI000837119D|nr:1-phosphofructokinase [Aliiruegeria sabulilitoris]NDR55222.1 1-phosphofructokinase [Pseudoruegeria sp. M32A2M]